MTILAHSPRAILKKPGEAAHRSAAISAYFASELEFYLFDESYDSAPRQALAEPRHRLALYRGLRYPLTTKEEGVMREFRNDMEAAGIPIENSKGEWGPGQEEINVRYAEALEMADRHVILKNGCQGNRRSAGQGDHLHGQVQLSAWPAVRAISTIRCGAPTARRRCSTTRRPSTHVEAGQQWAAGQLKYAKEFTWFLAPYINSYKRFQVGTFAPTKIMWSEDNRTAGFRLCGEGTKGIRMECRIGGADLNPYLAFAALIAAGPCRHRRKAGIAKALRRRRLSGFTSAGDPEDAARRHRNAGEVEDAERRSATT